MNDYQQNLARAREDSAFLRSVMLSVSKLSPTWRVSRNWVLDLSVNETPIPEHSWKWIVKDLIRQRRMKRCNSALVRGAIVRLRASRLCVVGAGSC